MTRSEEIELLNKTIKRRTAQIKRSKKAATDVLKELDVLTKTGKIRKKYKPVK